MRTCIEVLYNRWLKVWGVQIASERQLRSRAMHLTSNQLTAEEALFSFSLKSGGEELKAAPIVYIPHLKIKIFDLLEKKQR